MSSNGRARCVNRTGWHDNCYVTGRVVLGDGGANERIIFSGTAQSRVGSTAGTLEGWKELIAEPARGNSRLVFAISAAFAPLLLNCTGSESGGFHLVGRSSVGKTTALAVAGSVWGGGGSGGYLKSWRVTPNGLEGIAAAHCDALLCLDEMGQVNADHAGECAYMLANGVGKGRATRNGEARPLAEWRTIFLSSGELGLADKVAEGRRGHVAAAGQQVRIVDLPADAGQGLGLFEALNGFKTADELARHLKGSAHDNHGHAWAEFAKRIIDDVDGVSMRAKERVSEFLRRFCSSSHADGQVVRVAHRFGLVAAAGELAIEFGILPWSPGDVMAAVGTCSAAGWKRGEPRDRWRTRGPWPKSGASSRSTVLAASPTLPTHLKYRWATLFITELESESASRLVR